MEEKNRLFDKDYSNKDLFERYLITKEASDKIIVSDKLLPEKIQLNLQNMEEIEHYHLLAEKLWNVSYRKDDLKKILTMVTQDQSKYTEKIHQDLRNIRIGGMVLRDANRLFSKEHLNPELYYEFIKKLGLFNDNFERQTNNISAADVINASEEFSSKSNPKEFVPCTPQSLANYFTMEIDLIKSYLDKQKITRDELHDLKKTNRRFLNYFLLRVLDNVNDGSFEIYSYLRWINTCLGDCLDKNVSSNGSDFGQSLITIPEEAANLINAFQSRVVL